jgi:hypothetical protein
MLDEFSANAAMRASISSQRLSTAFSNRNFYGSVVRFSTSFNCSDACLSKNYTHLFKAAS